MKQRIIEGIICSVVTCLIGCSKEVVKTVNDDNTSDIISNKEVVFSATLEQSTATKTILQNDGKIYWSPEDSINVFGKNQYKFISTLKEDAPNTEFITDDNFEESDGQSFIAVYPYSRSNSYDGEAVTLSVPSSQIASSSTFDKDAFVMLAKSDEHTLSFRNLCGGIKVSITADGIDRIVFKGNNGEVLAGKVKVIFDESGYPVVSEIIEKESSVELIAPKDSTFNVGEWYYLSCLPADLSQGYTVEFYKEYSKMIIEASLVSNTPVVVRRSIWGRIQKADEDSPYDTVIPEDNVILYKTTDSSLVDLYTTNNVLEHYKDEESGYNVVVLESTTSLPPIFRECSKVVSVNLPSNITSIEDWAFEGCNNMIVITIPNKLVSIGKWAFYYCTSLSSITIPSSVSSIGEWAFTGCSGLSSITCGQYIVSLNLCTSFPDSYKTLKRIQLLGDVTSIDDGAFNGCNSLMYIDIPNGISCIGKK